MKKLLSIVFALILLLPLQMAAGQEIALAESAKQKSVEVSISESGQVLVKHIVQKSSVPRQIDLISGTKGDVEVKGADGGSVEFAMINGDQGVLFFPSQEDRVVEYELVDELVQAENGLWSLDFYYLESTIFSFPESIDMIHVNNNLILLDEKRGIKCHGCQMVLHFFEDEDVQVEQVVWEEHRFEIPIISLTEVESFDFIQHEKTIRYDIREENEFVTMILPQELLGHPYQTYLGEDTVLFQSNSRNETHVWLTVRPDAAGTVSIIGTTAIPEFSMLLPLVLGISLVAILRYGNRIIPR